MPAVSGPNAAGVPSVSESVAGTDPPTLPFCWLIQVTVTLNVFGADVLPLASLATQLTVVVPTVKFEPEAGSHVTTGFGSSLSVAVGSVNVTILPVLTVAVVAMSAGTAPSTGAAVSASVAPAPASPE